MAKWIYAGVLSAVLLGCATGKCVNARNTAMDGGTPVVAAGTAAAVNAANSGGSAMKPESKLDRVKVYKADGSLQCGQGLAVPLADMQKDLKDIKVYSSFNKNDGMMRIQVCGSPTGNSNVYEIDRKNLEAAIKLGFKEWTYDN
jgi:hypothetical protein